MNKTLKCLLVVGIVVMVLVFAGVATGKKSVDTISLDEYKELIKGNAYVFYGKQDNLDMIKKLAKDNGIRISFLDSADAKDEKLNENTLYEYKKGKKVYSYSGDLNSYKFTESLMNNGIIDKTYLTVSLDDYKKIKKSKGYHLMFIGRETCGYCTQFKDSIKTAMKDNDFMVYYIDTDTFASQDEYNKLVDTDKYMSENEWGTPLSLLYKDGKRIDVLNGYVSADELVKFLEKNKVI